MSNKMFTVASIELGVVSATDKEHALKEYMEQVHDALEHLARVMEQRAKPSLEEITLEINNIRDNVYNPSLYDERNDTSPKSFGMRKMGARKFR